MVVGRPGDGEAAVAEVDILLEGAGQRRIGPEGTKGALGWVRTASSMASSPTVTRSRKVRSIAQAMDVLPNSTRTQGMSPPRQPRNESLTNKY